MGAMTSGTTGRAKVLFRTYESWAGFFEEQNRVFGVTPDSCMFAQGSLAFTGNLNLYMGALYAVLRWLRPVNSDRACGRK